MTTTTVDRTSTSRVPLRYDGLMARAMRWYARRLYGQEMEPMHALLNHPRAARNLARFEMGVAKWDRLDGDLKELANLLVASRIGCSWCMDFGYYVSRTNGMAREKLEQVATWADSDAFGPLERKVLAYAEAMTATPPTVTDEMVAGLREELSDEALIELTAMIAVENLRSRSNSALGLTSQGFKDHCDIPQPGEAR